MYEIQWNVRRAAGTRCEIKQQSFNDIICFSSNSHLYWVCQAEDSSSNGWPCVDNVPHYKPEFQPERSACAVEDSFLEHIYFFRAREGSLWTINGICIVTASFQTSKLRRIIFYQHHGLHFRSALNLPAVAGERSEHDFHPYSQCLFKLKDFLLYRSKVNKLLFQEQNSWRWNP